MKVIIKKSELDVMITSASSYADKRDLSAIISHIFICAENGILQIQGTDLEIGLCYKSANVQIIEEGRATANSKKICDVIKSLKDDNVTIETKDSSILIKQKSTKYKLPMFNHEDFPKFPTIENKHKFDINATIFSRGLKKIFPCVDSNNPNYAMNGALIDIKENFINLVATDSRRLALKKLDLKVDRSENQIIIPRKAIAEMQKLFLNSDIQIYHDETILIAISENFEFYTKLINKRFPTYEKVIPTDFSQIIEIPRDKMVEGVKSVSTLCEISKITINPNSMKFESVSDSADEAINEIEVNLQMDEEISFIIKNKNILDFLSSIEDEKFTLKFKNSDVAFIICTNDFMTLLVPTTK